LTATPTHGYDFVEKVLLVKPAGFQVTLDDIEKKFFSTAPAAGFARQQTFC
jgi:hypothetical protein